MRSGPGSPDRANCRDGDERDAVGSGRHLHLLDPDPRPCTTYSGFAASLALAVILLPSVTRVVEEVLRVVPSGLREASLPSAPHNGGRRGRWSCPRPVRGGDCGAAGRRPYRRRDGAPPVHRLRLSGHQRQSVSQPQAALPLVIWTEVRTAQPVLIDLAFQAAFVLMSIVLILFVLARIFSRTKSKRGKKAGAGRQPGPNFRPGPDDE